MIFFLKLSLPEEITYVPRLHIIHRIYTWFDLYPWITPTWENSLRAYSKPILAFINTTLQIKNNIYIDILITTRCFITIHIIKTFRTNQYTAKILMIRYLIISTWWKCLNRLKKRVLLPIIMIKNHVTVIDVWWTLMVMDSFIGCNHISCIFTISLYPLLHHATFTWAFVVVPVDIITFIYSPSISFDYFYKYPLLNYITEGSLIDLQIMYPRYKLEICFVSPKIYESR